ncbi:chitobiase/beta-hexosaminidase C-terminal domain-containing protein [Bacteroidales bacterium OttesenSCG-928-B11]|nr:chitobiase/beta-hexosaminidase C-terminal domain-containing protein [Bacteroidales bacterium OttesenSCG-928-C03]MDL2311573.1 chitobiase/beta-hexosaminidase C-terminal domain-containing protein [Bacteroidales bacterium OttesenSCG-928-B11]MDL2326789.1 chitobiase/beta-hexosaminidase C-terminal domain-containing protein [Bacteroidales bacterium OttesenSCG-928-A14]
MKQQINSLVLIFSILFFTPELFSQTILYMENFGTPSANTTIQQYTGWQNQQVTYTGDGTCDVRTSSASTGYTGASGNGNVMLNNTTKWFSVSGINTMGLDSLKLHLGIRKGSTSEDGSNLSIQHSTDGENWTQLPVVQELPTGSGTTGWHYVTVSGLPAASNLRLKFSNLSTGDIRLDDLSITAHSTISTPTVQIISPAHGSSHVQSVIFNIVIQNFVLGVDGKLSVNIDSEGFDKTFNFSTMDSLTTFMSTPLSLFPGNYTLTSTLLDMNNSPSHPGATVISQFSITLPVVATPDISPTGGVYTEAQTVQITCETTGASIYYTLDGTTPDENGLPYSNPIVIENSCILKAIAMKTEMTASNTATCEYIIKNDSAAVILPFDISKNSETDKNDITLLNGFHTEDLGSSYADGSAKFEPAKAGRAQLYIRLDSSPDTLWFDLRGRNGGSAPQAYEGIRMEVLSSPDGILWDLNSILTENEISVAQFTNFSIVLNPKTRYVKWFLDEASKGNTQLNNIKIGKYTGSTTDTSAITNLKNLDISIHPNPTCDHLCVKSHDAAIQEIHIITISGLLIQKHPVYEEQYTLSLSDLTHGIYLLKIITERGVIIRKICKI